MGGGGKSGPTEEQRQLIAKQSRQISQQERQLADRKQEAAAALRTTGGLTGRALLMNDEVGQRAAATKPPLARTLGGA